MPFFAMRFAVLSIYHKVPLKIKRLVAGVQESVKNMFYYFDICTLAFISWDSLNIAFEF